MLAAIRALAMAFMTMVIVFESGSALGAQAAAETFVATAAVHASTGTRTAPVTIVVTRHTTELERSKVADALRTGGTPAVAWTASRRSADVGYIEVGGSRSPLRYAYEHPTVSGRLITVITASPIGYLGAAGADAKPKAGFDSRHWLFWISPSPAAGPASLRRRPRSG